MAGIGAILRKKTPKLYSFLVSIINSIKKTRQPSYTRYITDSLGGDFKKYFADNDMNAKLKVLTNNLDEQSCKTVNTIVQRQKEYPNESQKVSIKPGTPVVGGLLEVETEKFKGKISQHISEWTKRSKFPQAMMDDSVFYFYHGLTVLPPSAIEYIKNEEFIDLGAYVGDSVIALTDYDYKKIYSVEMSHKSIARYKENMKLCGIPESKYQVINVGVAANDDSEDIKMFDTGSAGFSVIRENGKYDEITVQQRSLDFIVEENKIEPKFIKVDIEGFGLEFIKGAKNTLQKYRPVISLAIYHNPYEFFEAKPMLESILDDYEYRIEKLTSGIQNNLCHSEVILMAYPKEISS